MTHLLGESFAIRQTIIRNRICIPPMVMFGYSDESGFVTDRNIAHYRELAQGNPGLIIQEATCVSAGGRLSPDQLGLWSDAQAEGHRRIAQAVHDEGCPIVMQIHHAGVTGIAEAPLCPSPYQLKHSGVTGREMTEDDVLRVQQSFIATARRACEAGYDGVELHGCHSYLLSQFFNSRVNHRTDRYRDPMEVVVPILKGIRAIVPEQFIVGIRLGCFEPTMEDGIRAAVALEHAGVDFLNISYGFSDESESCFADTLPFQPCVYGAGEIKKAVRIPVFAVNGICTPLQAQEVLTLTNVDMVSIGRSALVDPQWPAKALQGLEPGTCVHCASCAFPSKGDRCPGRLLLRKRTQV